MKPSMSESELLWLADLNRLEFWCESAKCIPNTEILQESDAVFINSGLDVAYHSFAFNTAMEPLKHPHDFIARAKAFFTGRKPAFSLMLRGHADHSIVEYCKENKVFLASEGPGMVLDKPIKGGDIPSGTKLRWVENEKTLGEFAQVVAEAFQDLGLAAEVSQRYFAQPRRVITPYQILAVVYLNGEPAATAHAILSHGIAGIYWVAVVKKARGKGLAEYCTREVGNAAFDLSARKVILQASKFGEPVYRKMGYREITRYPWFVCSVK